MFIKSSDSEPNGPTSKEKLSRNAKKTLKLKESLSKKQRPIFGRIKLFIAGAYLTGTRIEKQDQSKNKIKVGTGSK